MRPPTAASAPAAPALESSDRGSGRFRYLALIVFVGLCLAALAMVEQWASVDLREYLEPGRIATACALQVGALYVTCICWRSIVARYTDTRIGVAEALAHNGILLVGKYIPGKIWGGVARGAILHQRGAAVSRIVEATVLEQMMYMHAGVLVAGCALSFVLSPLAGAVALVIGIGTIALGGQVSRALLAAASRFAGRWRREMVDKLPAAESVGVSHYRRTVALYMLQWLLLGSILVALCVPAERLHESTLVLSYLGALPAAVILGFVAIWAPGGIGVREGTLVAVLALTMPVELAAVAALVYRLWCVVIDLLNGLYALLHLRRANPASPADEA